jgi:hypothetical protein
VRYGEGVSAKSIRSEEEAPTLKLGASSMERMRTLREAS